MSDILFFATETKTELTKPLIFCIGAALTDEIFTCLAQPVEGTSNPAHFRKNAGGVAQNIARNLSQLGIQVELISHFGNDAEGDFLLQDCRDAGIGSGYSRRSENPTGRFCAILTPEGNLFTAATVSHLEVEIDPAYLESIKQSLKAATLILADCNLSEESLGWLLEFSRSSRIPLILEPVSVPKIKRLAALNLEGLFLLTPNETELTALLDLQARQSGDLTQSLLLQKKMKSVWIRKGPLGSEFIMGQDSFSLPAPFVRLVDSTGAGDAALAGWIYGYLKGFQLPVCVQYGHSLAALVIEQNGSTFAGLHPSILESKFSSLYA